MVGGGIMGAGGSLGAVHSTLSLLPEDVSTERGFCTPEVLDRFDAARSALAPPAGTPSPHPDDVSDSASVCFSTLSERDDDDVSLDESVTDIESDGDGEGSSGGVESEAERLRCVNRRRQRREHETPLEDRDPDCTPGGAGKICDEKEVKAGLVYSLVAVFCHIVKAIFRPPSTRRTSPQLKKTVTECDKVVSLVCVE